MATRPPINTPELSRSAPRIELGKRIASGLLLAALALLTAWTGGLVLVIAFSILSYFVLREWQGLTGQHSPRVMVAGTAAIASAAVIAFWWGPVAAMGLAVVLLFAALGLALLDNPLRWTMAGMAYAVWLVISLISLRGLDDVGLAAILLVFVAVWSTDTAAYFGGRTFKGPKLSPIISPNKTWSGAICGAVVAVFACLAFAHWLGTWLDASLVDGSLAISTTDSEPVRWLLIAGVAFALSAATQAGDLFESAVKRRFNAKDSGTLVPGHGGVMDRVDGLIFASAAAFLIGLAAKGPYSVATGLLSLGFLG